MIESRNDLLELEIVTVKRMHMFVQKSFSSNFKNIYVSVCFFGCKGWECNRLRCQSGQTMVIHCSISPPVRDFIMTSWHRVWVCLHFRQIWSCLDWLQHKKSPYLLMHFFSCLSELMRFVDEAVIYPNVSLMGEMTTGEEALYSCKGRRVNGYRAENTRRRRERSYNCSWLGSPLVIAPVGEEMGKRSTST
jgi:hypothetical protein